MYNILKQPICFVSKITVSVPATLTFLYTIPDSSYHLG